MIAVRIIVEMLALHGRGLLVILLLGHAKHPLNRNKLNVPRFFVCVHFYILRDTEYSEMPQRE